MLHGIAHDAILKARHYTESERGPALVFEHDPAAQRLDHFLAERAAGLTVDQRLDLLRQVAEAVRYAHEKQLVHRALSPQSIMVLEPESPRPRLRIFNWQTGARPSHAESAGQRHSSSSLGISPTSHLDELVEDASIVYMAPEALADRGSTGREQDVFSLGALAYHLFSGQPPAADFYELKEKLRRDQGLRISSVLDGTPESLQFLIRFSTFPAVSDRLDSAAELLEELDKVEDELTTPDCFTCPPPGEPDDDVVRDPRTAKAGDRLDHGFIVKRRLGKGSTAVALLVEGPQGKEQVLKIALEPSRNDRLRGEAEVLEKLRRHQFIVQLQDVLELGDRVALLMDKAGDKTLAQRLRREGPLQLELLERFGEDLLQTVDWLEQEGVSHRDVKPENLGVAQMGRGAKLHLVLFDFSLARTPAENIRAGTVPYLDPFLALRKPPRWDTHAERFATAMTLYQMATGQLPRWGDGASDPAVLEVEVTLDADAFEPALRGKMSAFFEKALRRDFRRRFDNAQEMLASWREVFAAAGAPAVATDHADQVPAEGTPLDSATLRTPLVLIGLSTRALNALDRVGASTVEDLLRTPFQQISHGRGVGSKTRKELATFVKALDERFPNLVRRAVVEQETETTVAAGVEMASVDALVRRLLPASARTNAQPGRNALRTYLRLPAGGATAGEAFSEWPSQSDVGRELGLTRARISQVLIRARKRWLKSPAVTALRDEIATLLDAHGGVMTAAELAEAVVSRRGSVQAEPLRSRYAGAVVRVAVETERERARARWIVRRPHDGGSILIARDELDETGRPRIDGQRLADYAERLGRRADELAQADPLLPPDRVVEALQGLALPGGLSALGATRLRQLAVATSKQASLSSRLELYPRAMTAGRALRLALGALAGARVLTPRQIRERVLGRYPEARPLPDRPQLDRILDEAGSELRWQDEAEDGKGAFVAPLREFTTIESGTSYARTTAPASRFDEVPADQAEIRQFHKRLRHSLEQQRFLALVVAPRRAERAERALTSAFPLDALSFDELLIRHMKRFAAEKKIPWNRVLRADAVAPEARAGSRDWRNLLRVVRSALPRVRAELAEAARNVLLTHPGLLARYGQLAFLDELRDTAGRAGGPPGLWLLVPTDAQDEKPTLDGQPVPVFTTAQWARIPEPWLAARGDVDPK
ncbi:MAG: BREX system serine/threonine kinase PglW [bacterium]|nr:BREX system serine/threonine kinase PglW [bacterium]